MRTVKDHLVKWRLRSPSLIAQTPTSDIYKVRRANGKTAILKHWTKIGRRDEVNSNTILKWWRGQGAVRLYECDDEGQLLEFAEGKTLGEETRDQKLSDKAALTVVCELIRKLHGPHARTPNNLTPLDIRFRALNERDTRKSPQHKQLFARGRSVARQLLSRQVDVRPLHGDLHHDNIIASKDRGWLAIDPKGLIGDPYYDLGNLFLNPLGREQVNATPRRINLLADQLARELEFNRQKILRYAFAHAMLSAAWHEQDGGDGAYSVKIAELIAKYI